MRAAVYRGARQITVERVAVPRPSRREALIQVASVGVCGSDVAEWRHGPHLHPVDRPHPVTGHCGPIIPGHEFSGTVVAVGPDTDERWVGQRVACCAVSSCGTCATCRSGRGNLCSEFNAVGLHRHGALAEFVAAPTATLFPVGELPLSMDEAALAQPMAIAVHAVSRSSASTTDVAFVQGAGGVGTFLIHALAAAGVRVYASDRDPRRVSVASELGAEEAFVSSESEQDDLREVIGRCDVVFEATGSASSLDQLVEALAPGSRIVAVGVQGAAARIAAQTMTLKEQTLIGTNALVPQTDFPRALELLAAHHGRWSVLAPSVIPLEDLVAGCLAPMSEGSASAIKTLIDPSIEQTRPLE